MKNLSFDFYFLREPIIWIGQKFVYQVTKSEFFTFVFFDFIFGQILYASLKNLRAPKFLFYSILVSFPFILGFQNVYRQWGAQCALLYAYSIKENYSNHKTLKESILFVFACAVHNVAFIFLPVFLLRRKKYKFLKSITGFILCVVLIIITKDTKSQATTAMSTESLYAFFLALLVITPIFLNYLKIKNNDFEYYNLYGMLISIGFLSMNLLSSTGSERVFLFILFFSYPFFISTLEEKFIQKPVIRIFYILMFFLPILMFNVRVFIES